MFAGIYRDFVGKSEPQRIRDLAIVCPQSLVALICTFLTHNSNFESSIESSKLFQWSKHCNSSAHDWSSFFQRISFWNSGQKSAIYSDFLGSTTIRKPSIIIFDSSMFDYSAGCSGNAIDTIIFFSFMYSIYQNSKTLAKFVRSQLFFSFGTFYFFLAALGKIHVYDALP